MKTYGYQVTLCQRLLQEANWTQEDHAWIDKHFAYIKQAYENNQVLHVGRTENPNKGFGLVVYYAKNDEDAKAFMDSDPAVAKGLMQAVYFPYKVIFGQDTQTSHRSQAVASFNATWDYLDKLEKSEEEKATMIQLAHTSLYHWKQCGNAINETRGEWLIAHVYYHLMHKESAFYHAKRCYDLTLRHQLTDFDLTFAYEIMAKVMKLHQDDSYEDFLRLAYQSLNQIKQEGDKAYAKSQLDAI